MRLAAIPATVTDFVERLFVRCMMILLIAREPKGDGAAASDPAISQISIVPRCIEKGPTGSIDLTEMLLG
jgi:hypothetical protein